MQLLGSKEENAGASNRPQIHRTSQDIDGPTATGVTSYGFHHPQENDFPAFVPKARWPGSDASDAIVDVKKRVFIFAACCLFAATAV